MKSIEKAPLSLTSTYSDKFHSPLSSHYWELTIPTQHVLLWYSVITHHKKIGRQLPCLHNAKFCDSSLQLWTYLYSFLVTLEYSLSVLAWPRATNWSAPWQKPQALVRAVAQGGYHESMQHSAAVVSASTTLLCYAQKVPQMRTRGSLAVQPRAAYLSFSWIPSYAPALPTLQNQEMCPYLLLL